jgi:hypothetical protein
MQSGVGNTGIEERAERRPVDLSMEPRVYWPGGLALWICLLLSVALVIFYLRITAPLIQLPADILMWGETGFVATILKMRLGVPIYSAPGDSNSMIYTPLPAVLTYALSRLAGLEDSIPAWRWIQLGFVTLAALVGARCWFLLHAMAYPGHRLRFRRIWYCFVFAALFLAATAPGTGRFAHVLHGEPLALLVSISAFWAVLRYLDSPTWPRLLVLSLFPAIGFFTKQFLVSWAGVLFVFLLLSNPRDWKRLAAFIGAAASCLGIVIGICALLWGENFLFWAFDVMGGSRKQIGWSAGGYNLSIPRAIDHLIRAWLPLSIGFVGGLWVLRDGNLKRLGPLWIAWILLLASQMISSAAGWGVLYHFGPSVVIGMIWLLVACARWWPSGQPGPNDEFPELARFVRPAAAVLGIVTAFAALRVLPSGDQESPRYWRGKGPSAGVYQYVAGIEKEFEGLPAQDVLLDVGSWVHLKHAVIPRDQAIPLADQPPGGLYSNIDLLVDRIRSRTYKKILVRNLHSPFFLYDWHDWPRSSGVRQALLEHYVEVRLIPAPDGGESPPEIRHTGPVSVLVPRSASRI